MGRHGTPNRVDVRIEPWGERNLPLLEKLNAPEMTKHVGGPESSEKLAERQIKYEKPDSRQYRIVVEPEGEGVGGSATGRRPGTTNLSGRSAGP